MNPHTTQYVADYLSGSHAADNPLDYILSMLPIRPERITPLGMAELHLNKVSSLDPAHHPVPWPPRPRPEDPGLRGSMSDPATCGATPSG
jgi:hypothetical protein